MLNKEINMGGQSEQNIQMTKGEIKKLQILCHEIAESKGFYDGYNNRATWLEAGEKQDKNAGLLLALMHSEISEALEAIRAKDPKDNNLGEEMADLVIRALDASEYWNIDLEHEILKKIEKNKVRPQKHGKKF